MRCASKGGGKLQSAEAGGEAGGLCIAWSTPLATRWTTLGWGVGPFLGAPPGGNGEGPRGAAYLCLVEVTTTTDHHHATHHKSAGRQWVALLPHDAHSQLACTRAIAPPNPLPLAPAAPAAPAIHTTRVLE